jgi:DNA mismatch endonuclease (patch repair protein)
MSGPRWVTTSSAHKLSGRKSLDTAPEVALRRALHARGLRFRLHRTVGPRLTADILLPGRSLAIFVDGCFWHSCPRHGRRDFRGPNAHLWRQKLVRNRLRDERANAAAEATGLAVMRFWECEIQADLGACVDAVASRGR